MPDYRFPTDARLLCARLRGHGIATVRRQVLVSDYEELPVADRDQTSDGPTELVFDDGTTIHIIPNTEQMSVNIGEGQMPSWGEHYALIEPADNAFWTSRVGVRVTELYVLVSDHADAHHRSEFGLEFGLDSGVRLVLAYVSDDEHTDALVVSGQQPAGSYRRVPIV